MDYVCAHIGRGYPHIFVDFTEIHVQIRNLDVERQRN